MTYDELNEIILRGNPDEWLPQDGWLVYKGDLNLRIESLEHERDEPFEEDWANIFPGHPPTRQVFSIHYGATQVMEVVTVWIDQRTLVPLPYSDDHSSMSSWNYGFGKIIEAANAFAASDIYSLDRVIDRAGITVRDR